MQWQQTRHSQLLSQEAKQWLEERKTVTMSSSQFGLTQLRCIWLDSPPPDMAARLLDKGHVVYVAGSLNLHGIQQNNVMVLIFKEDIIAHPTLSLDNLDFTPFLDCDQAPVPMYVIAGDHTTHAVQMLHKAKPLNPTWTHMWVTLVLSDNTPEDRRMAQITGEMDNKIGSIKQEMSPLDYINQIHRTYMNLISKYGDPSVAANAKKINKDMQTYKNQCKVTMGAPKIIAEATLGTYFQIAKRTGEVWDLIEQVFTKHKANLRASSRGREITAKDHLGHSYFTDMASVDEALLVHWLQRIVDGNITVSDFKRKCGNFNKILKLQKCILTWYRAEYHANYDDYDTLVEKHPFLATKGFVSQVIGSFHPSKKNQTIPQSIADIIKARIESDKAPDIQVLSC